MVVKRGDCCGAIRGEKARFLWWMDQQLLPDARVSGNRVLNIFNCIKGTISKCQYHSLGQNGWDMAQSLSWWGESFCCLWIVARKEHARRELEDSGCMTPRSIKFSLIYTISI
jgi:hypothetical protein